MEAYYNGVLSAYPNSDCYSFGPSHWLVKIVVLPDPNSVPELLRASEIQIVPNPSEGRFKVNARGNEKVNRIVVTDISGRIILETDQTEVDMTDAGSGIYFVTAFTIAGCTTIPISLY